MGLKEYHAKRDFQVTPEPKGDKKVSPGRRFVVQKHAARRLHYDFRLELDGVLKSWAVPKGPSLDPGVRSLAVQTEDHPLEYGCFEGVIPAGEYGGGTVMLWDQGTWEPEGDAAKDYRAGKLKFQLAGEKLKGSWALVRMGGRAGEGGKNWLLIKHRDAAAKPGSEFALLEKKNKSVSSGRSMEQIAKQSDRVWSSNRSANTSKLKRKKAASANGRTTNGKKTSAKPKTHSSNGQRQKIDPSWLPQAQAARQPQQLAPQLATLVREPPAGDQWIHELKLDGYRILAFLKDGHCRLVTRRNNDWTERFQTIAQAIEQLPVGSAILDGEAVYLEPGGTTNFQALQNLMRSGKDERLVYFAFDLPYCEGYDLRKTPLVERKQLLEQLLGPQAAEEGVIRYSAHIRDQGDAVFSRACRMALEGIVSKRIDSAYESTRARSWLKVKCVNRQEFVIGGWSDPSGARKYFGALLLGYFDKKADADAGQLIYCGRCGTGFNQQSLARLHKELKQREIKQSPFQNPPRGADARDAHWVKPELIAEIEFAEWTDDGLLRQASFEGLREDKSPREVTIEQPKMTAPTVTAQNKQRRRSAAMDETTAKKSRATKKGTARTKSASGANEIAGVRISNPQRVIFPSAKITKWQLAEYYGAVGELMLPYIVNRPVTLVRCPRGQGEKCFYQKHLREMIPDPVFGIEVDEKGGTGTYVGVNNLAGLITLVQFGVIEFHPWGSRSDKLDHPDQIIFDLDPDQGVTWKDVVRTSFVMRDYFGELGLTSFPRTSGGKGLHVVIPIQRKSSWDEVKQFAHHVALQFVRSDPDRFVATMSKAKRKGKIFMDYLRNDRGSTAIACYSARARAGAPVATPLGWDELTPKIRPDSFSVGNVPQRLAKLKSDPWEDFFSIKQAITKKIQAAVRS